MKKLIYLFSIFIFWKAEAQTERYIYKTEINPDTINLVNMKVENSFLDIKGNQSVFVSEQRLLRDSLSNIVKTEENNAIKKKKKDKLDFPKLANGKSVEPSLLEFFIIKDHTNKTINLIESVGPKQVYYTEDRPINWTKTNETTTYNGYNVQKATVEFGGRNWTAWYTDAINISDGPYKFSGLPGLILKLEDENGDYKFSFIKKTTINNTYEEKINADAKQSTRQNFIGDKAAVVLENQTSKSFDEKDPLFNYRQNGGPKGQPMGNPNDDGFGGKSPSMNNQPNATQNNKPSIIWKSPNPIELKNK